MDSMRGQIPGDGTRRHFLRGLGLMGAGSLVAPYAIAQAPPKPTGPPHRIDIHHQRRAIRAAPA